MGMKMKMRHYYQAIKMIEFMAEGHNYKETAEEFSVHVNTVKKRLNDLKESKPNLYQQLTSNKSS